jgi:peptide/nickel transport system ATP-binding protein
MRPGETLGIVGESGSGKTTLARLLCALTPPTAGQLRLRGTPVDPGDRRDVWRLRQTVQMVFQDAGASLNPRHTVGRIVGEPLEVHGVGDARERERRVAALLERVGLEARHARVQPHELSGGQRQRVGIARALAPGPRAVILDEPVSALDLSVQAQILNLLAGLQAEAGLAYLFIGHDLGVVRHLSHRIAVLDRGRVVEEGPAELLMRAPRHPCTRALLDARPTLEGA